MSSEPLGALTRPPELSPGASAPPSRREPSRREPGRHRVMRRKADIPAGRDRLYEIDLLRLTAALAVVMYHYTFSGYQRHLTSVAFPALSTVTRYGYLGVDMFFVISGFVVLLSAWGRRPHEFVISRIVRLYPAYWVAVTITAVVAVTLSRGLFRVTLPQYVANLTMLNSLPNVANIDVVYWTLWAEIRFYLLVFVLAWIGINRTRVFTMLWLWLAATAVIEAHVLPAGPAGKIDLIVQSQWSHYFIAGMALCLIYRTGFSWQAGAIIVIAYGNAVYQAINFAHRVSDRYHQALHAPVIVAVVTVIFIVMTLIALRVTRRLGRPWFVVAGALTYPLYLVHAYNGFVLFNLFGRVVNRWVLLAAMVAGMCAVAYAIHQLVEARLAPRLKRALVGLADAVSRVLPGALRRFRRSPKVSQ
ncbi:MAG TPA: acyltransferase [Streptosporangiaceae bacterium]|nr:acyltransferase [Streptosporangiaceae bacterium]